MSKSTKALIKIVEKSASEPKSWEQAQQLILQGADIKASTSNGLMVHAVIAEEKRQRQILPWKADNCLSLIRVLEKSAYDQLVAQVFSENGGNLQEMRSLVGVRANCYRTETYGPLGMLGALVNQNKVPIRLDVVKFLIENDPNGKNVLTAVHNQDKTCLSLAKSNPKCPKEVIDFMQEQLDALVNQIPFTQPRIDPNLVITWIHIGANIEAIDRNGNTILCNAVSANNLELVRALLSASSNTTHKNNDGLTPLEIAKRVVPRNPPLIVVLEEQSVNFELQELIETKKSTLIVEEIQDLLEKGANINASMTNGDSPLHRLIASGGTLDMVKTFIDDFNADLSMTNNHGHRPIETCILLDKEPYLYLQTILALPKMTTDKFHNPKLNKTLLQFAIDEKRSGPTKLIQDELNRRLWNCVIRANTNDDNNKTIAETISQLVGFGAQINHLHTDQEYEQWTILHLAIKATTVRLLQYMIKQLQADYTLQNSNGDYPISIAAQLGHLPIVEYLHGLPKSNLNVLNKNNETPLHLAAQHDHFLVVRYLVQWGADDQIQNVSKQTPLDIARQNMGRNKEEDINNKKVIQFLSQLLCPPVNEHNADSATRKKPNYNLETCDLAKPVVIKPINLNTDDDDAAIGRKSKNLFSMSPNNNLHDAAKTGDSFVAKKAIGEGADIRYRKGNCTPYDVALTSRNEYTAKLQSGTLTAIDVSRLQTLIAGCQQIAETLRQIAYTKLIEAIQKSDAGLVMAYHRAGAPITPDLLYRACNASDNVEIVDYLLNQSGEVYQAMINDVSPNAPYHAAKSKKFNQVAMYIRFRLTVECTKAIKENNLELVKKLVKVGASVELDNTNNLMQAIEYQNPELVRFLCEKGAKISPQWLSAETIVLDSNLSQRWKPEIKVIIDQYLIERRLRFAAADGNLDDVIRCQRLGVNINSANCHGSTALLCTIQHGDYFPIVHTLVSRGASMLHSNEGAPMSLIHLATEQNYTQIASYLKQELNAQFLSAILNNDRRSAEKFAQLGTDFNYRDEQERTALHYAVQYHGIDLVTWLCECGSAPTICDINGDYPIIQAVEKGDYAVVELFVTKYPATKKQTNKSGMTALQIAQKMKFNRIAQLIETGKGVPESERDNDDQNNRPKHDEATLTQAARNGHMQTIREFIAQRYESKEQKKSICQKLIQVAKEVPQYEILSVLEPYYKTELRTVLASDMHAGGNIVLSERYKKILFGVLGSLSNLIATSSILLDPADPNTYTQFFVGLTENVAMRSQELQKIKTEEDVKKLIAKDESETKEQLNKIQKQLDELLEGKETLQAHIMDTDDRLFKMQKLTASQRKEFLKEKELHEKQLATYECSIFLFQRQQEATLNRKKAIEFLKNNMNLLIFYRTIENRLEALFHSSLAAQGGYVKVASTTKFGSAAKVGNMIPTNIPIIGLGATITKGVLSPVLSKLDEKQQKKEWHNISMLGNIEELRRVASETAVLLTLYYKEQIQAIEPSKRIKGSNVFNDKLHWLKQIFDVRPENSEEMAVVLVAEYITAWVIDGLKVGTEIIPTESLSQQLWLHVAKKDPTDLGKVTKVTDVLGLSAGQQKIPVKIRNNYNKEIDLTIQIRYLIGCVSVIGDDGSVYQYPVPENSTDNELKDLNNFGYVYVKAFSSDQKTLQSIVEGRKLHLAKRDNQSNILTRFEDIIQHAQAFINVHDDSTTKSSITNEIAAKVAEVLLEQKVFLDSKTVQSQLRETKEEIELSIDVLHEEIEKKTSYYQISIDAAHEQLTKESETNREAMRKDNEMRYNQALKKLSEHSEKLGEQLQTSIDKQMKHIEQQLQEQSKKILSIVEAAKAESAAAMEQAHDAKERSQQAVENSAKAVTSAENIRRWAEQRHEEFQRSVKSCEETVKQTALAQKQFCQEGISDIRTKAERDLQRAREAATQSASDAKESARSAKESQSGTQDVQKMMKNQLELHKTEIKKMIAEAKEIHQQSERIAAEAKEAQKQATRAADTVATTMEKVNSMQGKVEKALQQIEKLVK